VDYNVSAYNNAGIKEEDAGYGYQHTGLVKNISTPSPVSISFYITNHSLKTVRMKTVRRRSRTKLLARIEEEPIKQNVSVHTSKGENDNDNLTTIDQEIECPRCHEIMTLCSNFDKLCYVCEECSFLLSLN
jgi:phage FluMu protein Com